jgi:molybdate transport system regulatory protein
MGRTIKAGEYPKQSGRSWPVAERISHSRIVSPPKELRGLDPVELTRLEQAFRDWVGKATLADIRLSRQRILIIFLLIRYTGAKLNEVLALNPFEDIDLNRHVVTLGKGEGPLKKTCREVRISEALSREFQAALTDPHFKNSLQNLFRVDPGHVRRKFYERAMACGFSKKQGSPDGIRKARAVELMQSNMPLPVVQNILGHSTPNLTSALVSFSQEDIQQVAHLFLEREAHRKTSARNSFFGKISQIKKGDIQARVTLVTLGGNLITTVITNESLIRLGLKMGTLITAEIKAPLVMLERTEGEPWSTAENRFRGTVSRINRGKITSEYVVRIGDGTELCALISTEAGRRLALKEADPVWAVFNSFSVVLHLD